MISIRKQQFNENNTEVHVSELIGGKRNIQNLTDNMSNITKDYLPQ